jgi:hypothetical protein
MVAYRTGTSPKKGAGPNEKGFSHTRYEPSLVRVLAAALPNPLEKGRLGLTSSYEWINTI